MEAARARHQHGSRPDFGNHLICGFILPTPKLPIRCAPLIKYLKHFSAQQFWPFPFTSTCTHSALYAERPSDHVNKRAQQRLKEESQWRRTALVPGGSTPLHPGPWWTAGSRCSPGSRRLARRYQHTVQWGGRPLSPAIAALLRGRQAGRKRTLNSFHAPFIIRNDALQCHSVQ